MSSLELAERIIYNNFLLNETKNINSKIDLVKIWTKFNQNFFYSIINPFIIFPSTNNQLNNFTIELKMPLEYCPTNKVKKIFKVCYLLNNLMV